MQKFIFSLILVMTASMLSACSSGKKQEGPVFPAAGAPSGLKESLSKENPDWLLGRVTLTRSGDLLAAVSGIDTGKAKVGNVVVFYAGDQVVNIGKVVRIADGDLHVLYETPSESRRHVLVNDLAALIPQKN